MNPRLEADPSNVEQLRGWDGPTGDFWAANAERYDRGVAAYREPFLTAAAITAGENVLDIGCGTGQTTRDAARRASAGAALGVDLSSRMIELAREITAGENVGNATFQQADAQNHMFPERHFDVAISRTGTMFFGDPVAAFANIRRALRADGRLTIMVWQPFARNEWISTFLPTLAGREIASPPPFSLGDVDHLRAVLTAAGYCDVRLEDRREPMWFGRDAGEAVSWVIAQFGGLLDGRDEADRVGAIAALRADIEAHETADGVTYGSAVWFAHARV